MNSGAVSVAVVCLLFVCVVDAQMERQCTCSEFEPCKQAAASPQAFIQCADRCQNHVTALGASYPAVRQCILAYQAQFQNAAACVERSVGQACAPAYGYQVPKRYPSTTQLAAMREINTMLARSGLQNEARGLLSIGKKAAGCASKCIQGGGGGCLKNLGCGLALPSDNVLVSNVKQCAMASGFDTYTVRNICGCLANAGIRQLANMCSRIIIS